MKLSEMNANQKVAAVAHGTPLAGSLEDMRTALQIMKKAPRSMKTQKGRSLITRRSSMRYMTRQ